MPEQTHLVAGAAGFLGSHLVDRLLADGQRVIGMDNMITGHQGNLDDAMRHADFRFILHDITTPVALDENVTHVWNLASPASPPDYLKNAIHTLKVGALGTHHLLGLAKDHKARFFLASTSEVYGDPLVHPQIETYWGNVNPVGPRSVYDEAKRFAEALTFAYRKEHPRLETRIVRIFNTYGPRMRLNDGRVVPNFIGQALAGHPLTIYGNGKQTRSFCYYTDLIEGMVRLMNSDHQGPINIGNPSEMTINEFAQTLMTLTEDRLEVVHQPLPVDDPKQRCPDITLAKDVLGWEPKVPLAEGLRKTLEWFRTKGAPA